MQKILRTSIFQRDLQITLDSGGINFAGHIFVLWTTFMDNEVPFFIKLD